MEKEITEEKIIRLTKGARIGIIIGACVLVAAIVTGICLYFFVFRKRDEGYYRFFNTFESEDASEAIARTNLSEETQISSYNALADVFITKRTFTGNATGYGLASSEEEYVLPVYNAILQINGDYAIVVRQAIYELGETYSAGYVDVIRFRGEEGTPYSLMAGKSMGYSTTAYMPQFVGEYLVTYNELEETVLTPSYATFYEYKSWHKLLEKFRLRQAYDIQSNTPYKYVQADNYVAAYNGDKAYFYDTRSKIINGYLEYVDKGAYAAFPEIDADTLAGYNRELDVYYMGNGWFARSARLYAYEPFNGFNLLVMDSSVPEYSRTKVDFFNVGTSQSREEKEIYYIAGVANKYTRSYYSQKTYLLSSLVNYDTTYGVYEYNLPFMDPSLIVRDGYSIVYYYYQPYHDLYPYDEDHYFGYTGSTTFFIMDENLRLTKTDNSLMPIVYTDGVGISNADPEYTETRGTAYAYDKYLNTTLLAPFRENLETFYVYFANKYACILECTFTEKGQEAKSRFGAVTPDGKRITDFVYDEMSYFQNGYCVAQKKGEGKVTYYRVDMFGKEREIDDLGVLFQGVYTYKDGTKTGLKNYAGEVLIEAVDGEISVASTVMKDGKIVKTYAAVYTSGRTTIYEITGSTK